MDPLRPGYQGTRHRKGISWLPNLAKPLLTRVVFVLPVVRMAPPSLAWGKWAKPCLASNAACTNPVAKAASSALPAVWLSSATTANRPNQPPLLHPQPPKRPDKIGTAALAAMPINEDGFPGARLGTKSRLGCWGCWSRASSNGQSQCHTHPLVACRIPVPAQSHGHKTWPRRHRHPWR